MPTRPEAATLALHSLGGDRQRVDTEDIALRVAELAPGMFSWQKYRDLVDKELVRVALSDARLKAGYVLGSHADGWMLTPQGLRFARSSHAGAKTQTEERKRPGRDRLDLERARLLSSDAFLRFQRGEVEAITPDEADAFFRLNVYVQGEKRASKIARIENAFGEDPDLGPTVLALAHQARRRTS